MAMAVNNYPLINFLPPNLKEEKAVAKYYRWAVPAMILIISALLMTWTALKFEVNIDRNNLADNCINITASNVELNCAGFFIRNTTIARPGIYAGNNLVNVTVNVSALLANGTIVDAGAAKAFDLRVPWFGELLQAIGQPVSAPVSAKAH
jgi:hypothetical protein